MGMFSWNCLACGFSIRDCHGCTEDNWQGEAVVVTPGGSRIIGHYDGYGRVGSTELVDQIDQFGMYHKACWELAGKPDFTVPSSHAGDQGFCITKHDGWKLPKPTSPEWFVQAKTWLTLERTINAYHKYMHDMQYKATERAYAALSEEDRDRFDDYLLGQRLDWSRSEEDLTFEFGGREWPLFTSNTIMSSSRRERGLGWPASPQRVRDEYLCDKGGGYQHAMVRVYKLVNGKFEGEAVVDKDDGYDEEVLITLPGYTDEERAFLDARAHAVEWCLARGINLEIPKGDAGH